jgi:hypothetical protein
MMGLKCSQQSRLKFVVSFFLFNNQKRLLSVKKLKKYCFLLKRKNFFILSKNEKKLATNFCLDCCGHFEPKVSKNGCCLKKFVKFAHVLQIQKAIAHLIAIKVA